MAVQGTSSIPDRSQVSSGAVTPSSPRSFRPQHQVDPSAAAPQVLWPLASTSAKAWAVVATTGVG